MRSKWAVVALLFSFSLLAITSFWTGRMNSAVPLPAQPSQNPFFTDSFSGSSIDSSRWNTTFATSGLRWCPSTVANHEDVPGLWQDPSVTFCQGVSQTPPYGSVSVGGGSATLSSVSSRAFPYIWSGVPSKASPFPLTGNFVLETKIAYDSVTGSGDGLFVARWPNTDPVGNNPPGGSPRILVIFADSSGLNVQLLGNQTYHVYNELATHDYILEYVNGQYSVFVDGYPAIGPTASSARASSIWLGNPVFTWWQPPVTWTSFSISLVQVTIPSVKISPPSGPIGTKVVVQGSSIPVSQVEVTFDDNFIGTTSVSGGNFNFILDVPVAQNGPHQIKTIDQFSNVVAAAPFTVTSSNISNNLAIALTVGTIYFPGDNVVARILVTVGGVPSGPSGLQVNLTLTKPDNTKLILHDTDLGSGIFESTYSLPRNASIGTYNLVAAAHNAGTGDASAIASFEVKLPWLSSQASNLAIAGVASIATLGVVVASWRRGYFKRTSKDSF